MPNDSTAAAAAATAAAETCDAACPEADPAVDTLMREIILRAADRWSLQILELLHERGTLRFTEIGRAVGGISQKMLTQTLRGMEADGLVARTVHPVIPPRVEYRVTDLGTSLGAALCGLWHWAGEHHAEVMAARQAFRERATAP